MSGIREALDNLENEICNSTEYLDYSIALDKLKKYPELKALVDEFRSTNFKLQSDPNFKLEHIDEIEREHAELRANPLVSEFLAAELALCRMMQKIAIDIVGCINFE